MGKNTAAMEASTRASFHHVRPDAFNYAWDNSFAPALEVEDGATVHFTLRDASDEQIDADSDASAVERLDFSHVNPVSGPVYVRGARAGDVLAVELLEFTPRDWGWTAIIPGFGLLADEYPEPWLRISDVDAGSATVRFGDGISLPYRPFPGTIGVAPAEPGRHSIVPPSRFGGNMDTKHLGSGTTLFLPVGVDGALFSVGDTHAAQGDGEVCGTAIECPLARAELTLDVRDDLELRTPIARVDGAWLAFGFDADLDLAAEQAMATLLDLMERELSVSRDEALALASVAVDLRVTQLVNGVKGVHAILRDDAIR